MAATAPAVRPATLPYLPEVARVEIAWSAAWAAADADPVATTDLAHSSPEQLLRARFELHPATRLLQSGHPAGSLWTAHQGGGPVQASAHWGPEDVLITRPQGPARSGKPPLEAKIEATRLKLEQLKAREVRIENRQRFVESKLARREDTRRKILIGAVILARIEQGKFDEKKLRAMLDEALTRQDDRRLFGL